MNMAKIEARAAELHEGCRMPMEQELELAASERCSALGKLAEDAGMVSLLDNGAASCVYSDGCHGVCQEHLERFVALVRAERDSEMERLRVDLDDYLRHVIDMTKGEHYFDVVRENAAALLKRLPSVLGPNPRISCAEGVSLIAR